MCSVQELELMFWYMVLCFITATYNTSEASLICFPIAAATNNKQTATGVSFFMSPTINRPLFFPILFFFVVSVAVLFRTLPLDAWNEQSQYHLILCFFKKSVDSGKHRRSLEIRRQTPYWTVIQNQKISLACLVQMRIGPLITLSLPNHTAQYPSKINPPCFGKKHVIITFGHWIRETNQFSRGRAQNVNPTWYGDPNETVTC